MCLEQQKPVEQDNDSGLHGRGSYHTPLRLRDLGQLSHHRRLIECFHQRCIRIILNVRLSDFVTNVEFQEQAEIPNIEALLLKYQLRWAGHVSRIEDHRLPKIILHGELSTGLRYRGALKKHYKDCLKKSSPPVILTLNADQTWQRTTMPGTIRSSTLLTSLIKPEEMHIKIKGKRKA